MLLIGTIALSASLAGGGIARADQLQDRVSAGSDYAKDRGTTVEIAMLDRVTGKYNDNGSAAHTRIESASVMKVFIAENLLHRRDQGKITLSTTQLASMKRMLRESYDVAANQFWSSYGANTIVKDVIKRYGLTETRPTTNVRYWGNTRITAHDMIKFYKKLLDGSGGLSAKSRTWMLTQLKHSTEQGDGGRQFFGLHDGLPDEKVIYQKQGWMCCVSGARYRHSTGLVDSDQRYIVVVLTKEASSRGTAHIEKSITGALKKMFPEGEIPRVQGVIGELWFGMGGKKSTLGMPTSDQKTITGGARQTFAHGVIYWSKKAGAHPVTGTILTAYTTAGRTTGTLGYPTGNQKTITGGLSQTFTDGTVYWSKKTGAHPVTGRILTAYTTAGGPTGTLGYPTRDARKVTAGTVVEFQHGSLTLTPAGTVVRSSTSAAPTPSTTAATSTSAAPSTSSTAPTSSVAPTRTDDTAPTSDTTTATLTADPTETGQPEQ